MMYTDFECFPRNQIQASHDTSASYIKTCYVDITKRLCYFINYEGGIKLKILHCRNSSKYKYQNGRKEAKSIILIHKYIRAHFPVLVQALQ